MSSSAPLSSPGPLRIIVADDHDWIREVLIQVAQQTLPTAEIISTVDGAQAWDAYQRGGCDFLISNHIMPHMDGATLIRKVRAQDDELPILMVSVKPEVAAEALAAGANWFLRKEQIMEQMPALLRQYAGRNVAAPL